MAINEAGAAGVDSPVPASGGSEFRGRHVAIGGNVLVSVALVVGIVGVLQWGSYLAAGKVDLTDSGVNSLSPGTERLLGGLDQTVRYTSLYFETDLEDEDQSKYRTVSNDLLKLYQGANRQRIELEFINPLKDLAARRKLVERLQGLERFQKEAEPYRELADDFTKNKVARLGELITGELGRLDELASGTMDDREKNDLAQVQALFRRWQEQLPEFTREVNDAVHGAPPRFRSASTTIASLYSEFSRSLTSVEQFSRQLLADGARLSAATRDFFSTVEDRYTPVIEELESGAQQAQDLPTPELDEILRELGEMSNAIVVESESDATVVRFADVWPRKDRDGGFGPSRFADRLFRGEDKLTAATLRVTQDEKTAVVFVRYAGPPLFFSGFGGQPMPAPYLGIQGALEDTNFSVHEWDVSSTDTPPEIDPPAPRSIYVVLRPNQPPQGPFNQSQQQPFDETHLAKVRAVLGELPRAIFLGGWEPGGGPVPGMIMPTPYAYASYLEEEWGIAVDAGMLVIKAMPSDEPGSFELRQQSFSQSEELVPGHHMLVANLGGKVMEFPFASPVEWVDPPVEEAVGHTLIETTSSDTVWAVTNIQPYIDRARSQEKISLLPEDRVGPFTLAVAAEKGDGKVVVIGSSACMTDQVAMQEVMVVASQGFSVRKRNPGNLALLLNSLHWLNDKDEWMDVGQPATFNTLEIAQGPAMSFIRVLVVGIWPALALCCGLVAWRVRRS